MGRREVEVGTLVTSFGGHGAREVDSLADRILNTTDVDVTGATGWPR
jgi:hypothetical protein